MSARTPRFCSQCGGTLADRFFDAELRVRRVCARCGEIAYRNPLLLVTTIVESGNRVLLCRRANPPAAGRWTLPGGFMEAGETLEAAAARETCEETGVRLDPGALRLYAVAALPDISEVYVGFLATAGDPAELHCGAECTDVRFFNEVDLPWAELAYADIGSYLRMYFSERRDGAQMIHLASIETDWVVSQSYRIAEVERAHRLRPSAASSAD